MVYELKVIQELANRGWPVPQALSDPLVLDDVTWVVLQWLPGTPMPEPGEPAEQRSRGRLLAQLHQDSVAMAPMGQRSGWSLVDALVADPELDLALSHYESYFPEDARVMRWHLDQAREALALSKWTVAGSWSSMETSRRGISSTIEVG
jgi:fructosamine-3-kinase